MRLLKKKAKRSKKILARQPERIYSVKEVRYIDDGVGTGKRPIELYYTVRDYCYSPKFSNYE